MVGCDIVKFPLYQVGARGIMAPDHGHPLEWMPRDISRVYKNGGSPFWCLPGEDSECTAH